MMVSRFFLSSAVALSALALVACGDQPQELTGEGIQHDSAPYQGVGSSQYAQEGWKPGDRSSWEQQLKTRAQYGQNDYTRMSN